MGGERLRGKWGREGKPCRRGEKKNKAETLAIFEGSGPQSHSFVRLPEGKRKKGQGNGECGLGGCQERSVSGVMGVGAFKKTKKKGGKR